MSDTVSKAVDVAAKAVTSPDVQAKVVSMLDALQQGAVTVGSTVVKYTPAVVNAALDVIKLNGIQDLVLSIGGTALAVIFVLGTIRLWKWSQSTRDLRESPALLIPIFTGAATACIAIYNIVTILDIWLWVEIFEPKLWIAKQLVNQVLK